MERDDDALETVRTTLQRAADASDGRMHLIERGQLGPAWVVVLNYTDHRGQQSQLTVSISVDTTCTYSLSTPRKSQDSFPYPVSSITPALVNDWIQTLVYASFG
jgi:hypothetical protein